MISPGRLFSAKSLVAFLLLVIPVHLWAAPPMNNFKGDDTIDFSGMAAGSGVQFSWGSCPCIRWTINVQVAGAHWETKSFLISTEALAKFKQSQYAYFDDYASRSLTVGAFDALVKGAHIGFGFDGFRFGKNRDLGYSSIFLTGLYALVNLVQFNDANAHARVDLQTAYDYESMRVNLGPIISRHIFEERAIITWQGGSWSGTVSGYIGAQRSRLSSDFMPELGGQATAEAKVAQFKDIQMDLGMDMGFSWDSFRDAVGMASKNFVTGIYLDFAWVGSVRGAIK